jgi:transcriptional regulator with XRE-family HTH domain
MRTKSGSSKKGAIDARDGRILENIAANARAFRAQRGMTQEALAEAADLDVRQVQRIEAGRIDIGVTRMVRVAAALDVDVGRLVRPPKLEKAKARRTR